MILLMRDDAAENAVKQRSFERAYGGDVVVVSSAEAAEVLQIPHETSLTTDHVTVSAGFSTVLPCE